MRKLLVSLAVLGTVLLAGCEGESGVDSTSTVDSVVKLADPPRNGVRPTPAEDDPAWDCSLHGDKRCGLDVPDRVTGLGIGL